MKGTFKTYRIFLWCGLIFSAICLLTVCFMKPPVEAGMHDIIIFKTSGVILFVVFTFAFAMKLFCKRKPFVVGKIRYEICYWAVVSIIAVSASYLISFAHTEKYQSDYAAYTAEQKRLREEASKGYMTAENVSPTEKKAEVTTMTTSTMAVTTTTTTTTAAKEATTEAIKTEPATEAETETTITPDALIDTNGTTYYFEDKVEFEDFDVKINRLKLVSDLDYIESDYNFYYIMIDYTVYNKSDYDISYDLNKTGNVIGSFRFHGYERRIGGNFSVKDDDFVETDTFKFGNGCTVGGQESVHRYYCGIIDRGLDDPDKGMCLRADDEMEIDLYFCVNDIYNIVTLELN